VARILVVDDEVNLREVVGYALRRDGHQVEAVGDGEAALARVARGGIELIVLDVLLPELDGLGVCRRLRPHNKIPVLFLSSRGEETDRVLGLDLGGDDYLVKPFSPRELAARVRALLRRHGSEVLDAPPVLSLGRLSIDRARHEVRVDGKQLVAVTVPELRLLAALAAAPGRVLRRDQLIACAYEGEHHVAERTIDTHVRNLRAKLAGLGVDAIETVHGLGYRGR
jgi:two-component system OmpR family response regulator